MKDYCDKCGYFYTDKCSCSASVSESGGESGYVDNMKTIFKEEFSETYLRFLEDRKNIDLRELLYMAFCRGWNKRQSE